MKRPENKPEKKKEKKKALRKENPLEIMSAELQREFNKKMKASIKEIKKDTKKAIKDIMEEARQKIKTRAEFLLNDMLKTAESDKINLPASANEGSPAIEPLPGAPEKENLISPESVTEPESGTLPVDVPNKPATNRARKTNTSNEGTVGKTSSRTRKQKAIIAAPPDAPEATSA